MLQASPDYIATLNQKKQVKKEITMEIIKTIKNLMADSAKTLASAKKVANEKTKDFKAQDYNKKVVKTAILVTCVCMSPLILLLVVALIAAIIRFVPTWLIVVAVAGIAARKIYKKTKTTVSEDIVDIDDIDEEV